MVRAAYEFGIDSSLYDPHPIVASPEDRHTSEKSLHLWNQMRCFAAYDDKSFAIQKFMLQDDRVRVLGFSRDSIAHDFGTDTGEVFICRWPLQQYLHSFVRAQFQIAPSSTSGLQVIEKADIALTIESIVDGLSWSAVWTPEEHEAGMDYLVIPKGKTILGRLFPEIQYLAGEFSTKLRQNIPKPHTTK